jgi:DNA-binding IscR family transcriptional regulator
MGFLGFGNKKATLVTLTELGKQKSEQVEQATGLRLKVVSYLEENGASSISEISSKIGYPQEQVKEMVNRLYKEQWVTIVKNAGGD